MSRFPAPPPDAAGPLRDRLPAGSWDEGRPYSKASIAGFIASLLFFLLLIGPLLGFVLGIVGLFKTRQRRLRGRGLAIAAVIISLLVGTGQIALGGFLFLYFNAISEADGEVVAMLRASGEDPARLAATLYDGRLSVRFSDAIDREVFLRWAADVRGKYGQLQTVQRDHTQPIAQTDAGGFEIRYIGEFVNGKAAIAIRYRDPMPGNIRIDDILVDGISAASN